MAAANPAQTIQGAPNFTLADFNTAFAATPAVIASSDTKLELVDLNNLIAALVSNQQPNPGPAPTYNNNQGLQLLVFFSYTIAIKGATHETNLEENYTAPGQNIAIDLNSVRDFIHNKAIGFTCLRRTFANQIVSRMYALQQFPFKWAEQTWPEAYKLFAWPGSLSIENARVPPPCQLTDMQRQFIKAKQKDLIQESQENRIQSVKSKVSEYYAGRLNVMAAHAQITN